MAWPFFERGFGFLEVEIAVGIDEFLGFLLPYAHHLCGFLLERHSRQEILDAFGDGQGRVFVGQGYGIGFLGGRSWLFHAFQFFQKGLADIASPIIGHSMPAAARSVNSENIFIMCAEYTATRNAFLSISL
jgi:hypothetical protein